MWFLPDVSYVRVAQTVGTLSENRTDIATMSVRLLQSTLPGPDRYLTVAYDGGSAPAPTERPGASEAPAASVAWVPADLADGAVTTKVRADRTSVVVLSASYDPGWTVTADGRQRATEMVAPALVAVRVGAGTHVVQFRYTGFGDYPGYILLLVIGLVALAAYTVFGWRRRRAPAAT